MTLDRLWAGWRSRYVSEEAGKLDTCFLCALGALPEADAINERTLMLERTEATLTVMNLYPYGSGHLLIAPRRHEGALDALAEREAQELMAAQRRAVRAIKDAYGCDGINLGANLGLAAGAGLPDHLHFHALPRWAGDTNFMTAVAETRVLPESLETGWAKLHKAWPSTAAPPHP
jgi:ATP adenylyltransferase